jgi:hypothetical protein
MRAIVGVLVLVGLGCGADGGRAIVDGATDGGRVLDDDASISDSGLPDAPDVPPSPVTVTCHELELAINDAGATLRWYGGVLSEATPRTEVTVDGVRWLRDGRTPGALVPGQRAKDTPLIQHEVLFELEPAPEEAALCDAAPALIRGFETERVELEVTGTSAEGPWVGTCSVPADEVFVTCHSGSSRVAHAMAGNYPANVAIGQPEPYGDATVTVYTREPLAADFTVLELWVADDAGTVRRDLDLAGIAHTQVSPEGTSAGVFWNGMPHPEELCPAAGAFPSYLEVGYRLSSGGAELSGMSVAGVCQGSP